MSRFGVSLSETFRLRTSFSSKKDASLVLAGEIVLVGGAGQ